MDVLLGEPAGVFLGGGMGVFLGGGTGVVLGDGTGVARGGGFPLGVVEPGPPVDVSSGFGVLALWPWSQARCVACRPGDDFEHLILEIILEICSVSL